MTIISLKQPTETPLERGPDAASRPWRAMLLDLDGTVADTHELIYCCFHDTVHHHTGSRVAREHWAACVGLPLGEMFRQALERCGREDLAPESLVGHYRRLVLERDADVTAFPGMAETLAALRARGVRLGIVTTKYQGLALRHLQATGLAPLFEAVVTGDQVTRCKPDPEPFQRGCALLGVDPADAVGVGDSEYDVVSARAAGLTAVAACWGAVDGARLLAAGPHHVARRPEELLGLLERA